MEEDQFEFMDKSEGKSAGFKTSNRGKEENKVPDIGPPRTGNLFKSFNLKSFNLGGINYEDKRLLIPKTNGDKKS